MIEAVEIRNGYYWPKTDVRCWQYMMNHPNLPIIVTEYVSKKNRKTVVQAGGNAGFYPKQFASLFENVYTFEPDWLNFYCLNLNTPYPNVIKSNGCLGNDYKLVSLSIREKNRGKNFVNGPGNIPTYRIDDLKLDACSLIQLDVEGFEYYSLQGGIETIKAYKPVIVLEIWDRLTDRFEKNLNQKLFELLDTLGYVHECDIDEGDKLFIAKK